MVWFELCHFVSVSQTRSIFSCMLLAEHRSYINLGQYFALFGFWNKYWDDCRCFVLLCQCSRSVKQEMGTCPADSSNNFSICIYGCGFYLVAPTKVKSENCCSVYCAITRAKIKNVSSVLEVENWALWMCLTLLRVYTAVTTTLDNHNA